MKLSIFYSWQSDLPNNINRGFISECLEKATKNIYEKNKFLVEYKIDSDSRDELGTPDIVSNIFSKIDTCDIFIADITIINKESTKRKTPNPNVLIELGYASSAIGWENIICVFNDDFGIKEDLPFDIRFRKPLSYSTFDKTLAKKNLTKLFEENIQKILETRIDNKSYYNENKQHLDLSLQVVLMDLLKILNFSHKHDLKLFDYAKLLNMTEQEINDITMNMEILGFQLFRNLEKSIKEFTEYFNDDLSIFFFDAKEKNRLAKIIMSLKRLEKILYSNEIFEEIGITSEFKIISALKMNPNNAKDGYLLLNKQNVVIDMGYFSDKNINNLNKIYKIKTNYERNLSLTIYNLIVTINDWIRVTGGQFIFNSRLVNLNI